VVSSGLSSTSDIITFDRNGHHLCSTPVGGKDLSNDTHTYGARDMHKNAQKVE